jgi:uncharacterized membrane protein YebE (DUF533 family)
MIDPKKLLDQLLGSSIPGTQGTVRDTVGQATELAKNNKLATGALLAVLLGTSKGRSVTSAAVKVGGLAAIAGLGYQAWQNYKSGKPVPGGAASPQPAVLEAPAGSGFELPAQDDFALVLVRAMIAAARADGHIDDAERARIADKVALAGLGGEERDFLLRELEQPVDLDALLAAARTEPQKVELYTASRLAIEPDTRAERGYLDLLAGRLQLPDALVDHIESTVAGAKAQA